MANNEVLLEALNAALENPHHHNQTAWISTDDGKPVAVRADNSDTPPCGTTLCLAGWIAFQQAPAGSTLRPTTARCNAYVDFANRDKQHVRAFAEEAAGLTRDEAEVLFSAFRTPEALSRLVAYIIANPDSSAERLGAVALYDDALPPLQ